MRGIILALALFAEIAAGPARADWAEEVSRPRTPVTLGASASCCSTARSSSGLATACRFGAATRCWKGCFLPEAEVWRVEPDLARAGQQWQGRCFETDRLALREQHQD